MDYTYIACIAIDSVIRIDKKPSDVLFRGVQIYIYRERKYKCLNS